MAVGETRNCSSYDFSDKLSTVRKVVMCFFVHLTLNLLLSVHARDVKFYYHAMFQMACLINKLIAGNPFMAKLTS